MNKINFAILTVSDSCYEGKAEDLSGKALERQILEDNKLNGKILRRELVPDDLSTIKEALINICDVTCPDVLLTTGGTGFSPRDVTPEATKAVIAKEAPGMSLAMLQGSLKITPMAMLSRPVCGIRNKTLIVNLPGSKKGSTECLSMITAAIPHAVHLLRDDTANVRATHSQVQAGHHQCTHNLEVEHEGHGDLDIDLDQLPLARRARKSQYKPIPVDEALSLVLQEAQTVGVETVHFMDCGGRVLAEDIYARDPLPPFPASIKDGYAVIADDGIGVRTVLGELSAGADASRQAEMVSGQCVRINTGAPIPPGANAVVQVEDTKLVSETDSGNEELEIEILAQPKPGQDIRQIGSDIERNQKVLSRGKILGCFEQGVLAAVGVTKVEVYKLPTIGLLSTGNELVQPDTEILPPGKIRDSNKSLLMCLLRDKGFQPKDLGVATDNQESLVKVFEENLGKCDVIISTGGVSMGDKDLLKPVLKSRFNAQVHFGRVFMKPGLPTTFMTSTVEKKKTLIFALPGNPVSAAVTCYNFVIPALRKMSGYDNPHHTRIKVKTGHDIVLDARPEFQRGTLDWATRDSLPLAHATEPNQISSKLLNMVGSQGLLILPPSTKNKPRLLQGELIDCYLI